jgi:DNA-binding MarR family transcriptional regulator
MELHMNLPEKTAEQILELFQQLALQRVSLVPPEHVIHLQKQLERTEHGSGNRIANFPLLLRIFIVLMNKEIPPTMGELGAELETPLSSTTRIVDWLVSANIIERVDDPDDRRIVRVRLTGDGRRICQIGMDYNKKQIMKMLAIFSPEEQQQLLRLMDKFVNTILAEE